MPAPMQNQLANPGLGRSQAGSQMGGSGAGLPGFDGKQAQPAQPGKHHEGGRPGGGQPQQKPSNWALPPQALMAVQQWESQLKMSSQMPGAMPPRMF
jgi:hypothetical protein